MESKRIKSAIPQNPSGNASIESEESCKNDTVQSQQGKQEKKAITIIGDSILNGIKECGLNRKHHVRVGAPLERPLPIAS